MDINQEIQENYGQAIASNLTLVSGLVPEDFDPGPGLVLVEIIPPDTQTAGGIILPTQAQEPKAVGIVRRISSSDRQSPCYYLREGDLVLFAKDAGDELTIAGKDYKVLTFMSRDGVLEGEILGKWPAAVIEKIMAAQAVTPPPAEAPAENPLDIPSGDVQN